MDIAKKYFKGGVNHAELLEYRWSCAGTNVTMLLCVWLLLVWKQALTHTYCPKKLHLYLF
jgi:hypothetical protein